MTVYTTFTRKLVFLPILFVLLLLASGPGFCDPLEVVDLGFYYGAGDLNNSGQVTSAKNSLAVIWDAESGITQIGQEEILPTSYGMSINNNGHVVGWGMDTDSHSQGFYWNGTAMTYIGTLGGDRGDAWAINDNNAITGTSKTADGDSHAFLWINGTMQDLGTLGGRSYGRAINNSNEIAGYFRLAGSADRHAFLWSDGVMQDLGTLGGTRSIAWSINEAGQVVGESRYDDETTDYQAFLWENGTLTGLGFLDDGDDSCARDINNLGQIVGYAEENTSGLDHAVLWKNSEIIDLNDLIEASSGWVLERALSINDNGVILGFGTLDGENSLFLLDISSVVDSDGDGIVDADDNCPATANADQTDTDADGYGNMCDCDIDGDDGGNGAVNMADYAVFRAAYGSTGGDASENWNPDADFNGDLEVNMADYAIFRSRWLQTTPFH